MKTNKSYTKRLKVSKRGKILSRKAGQNHFNAKERRRSRSAKKRGMEFHMSKKLRSRYLVNL
ncbi:MAG: 50S ribosomal protein L35 [Minisyncoccia bacterium]